MIAAGRLRHRIDILESVEARTPTGSTTVSWQPWALSVAAEFAPISVRELYTYNAQFASIIAARVTLRYREGMNARMRIQFRGKLYNIEGVMPDRDSGLEYFTVPVSEVKP